MSFQDVIVSPLDVYSYLESHIVRVYDKSGREFLARPRCLGYSHKAVCVAELEGMGSDGTHYHLQLSGVELARGVTWVDDSTVRVYDANGHRVYIEFFTQARLHL